MPRKIDVHAHLYSEQYIAELERLFDNPKTPRERLTNANIHRKVKTNPAMWTVDERLGLMERLEVDYQVLSLSLPQAYEGDAATRLRLATMSNDLFARTVQQHPNRFLAFGSLPLPDIDASLKELARCLDELKFSGICLGSSIAGLWLDDERLRPVFDELDRRGTTIFLHPMIPTCCDGIGDYNASASLAYIYDTGLSVYRMLFAGMFDRYRRFKLIVPHLGGMLPYHIGRIEGAWKSNAACKGIQRPPAEYLRELYYDVVNFYTPALHLAAEAFGTDHLLLGSDYPFGMGDVEAAITSVRAAFPDERDQAKIFGENAEKLLGL